jgi:hypothetical protein
MALTVDCTSIPDQKSNTGGPYQQEMNTEASWTARYGLYEVLMKADGPSGEIAVAPPLKIVRSFNYQNMGPCVAGSTVNFTERTQNKMIQMLDLSSGGITIFGTYVNGAIYRPSPLLRSDRP